MSRQKYDAVALTAANMSMQNHYHYMEHVVEGIKLSRIRVILTPISTTCCKIMSWGSVYDGEDLTAANISTQMHIIPSSVWFQK